MTRRTSIHSSPRLHLLLLALTTGNACTAGDPDDTTSHGEGASGTVHEPGTTAVVTTEGDADTTGTEDPTSAATTVEASTGAAPPACGAAADADPCLRCGQAECSQALTPCCELTEFDGDGAAVGGCLPLVVCAVTTGCIHAACYDPATCMSEVDGAGGIIGDGTMAAGALGECLGPAIAAAATEACAACKAQLTP